MMGSALEQSRHPERMEWDSLTFLATKSGAVAMVTDVGEGANCKQAGECTIVASSETLSPVASAAKNSVLLSRSSREV